MGLSSSQGRLLMLTSRLSDIELSEIMISQRQNQLAWDSEKIAKEYNEAMNNQKLQIKMPDGENNFRKEDLTFDNTSSMGYLVTNAKGQLYLKKENGQWVIPTGPCGNPITDAEVVEDENGNASIVINGKTYEVLDGTEAFAKKETLQNGIMNGVFFLMDIYSSDDSAFSIDNLPTNQDIELVLDTSDDAQAEAKYEYETAKIARQDNKLELEMKQLETQHNAIAKEIDSVKEVIGDNIERTFNLFSDG